MANLSEAQGKVTLIGRWTPKMRGLLNRVCDVWRNWDFYIDISQDETKRRYQNPYRFFYGCGKWTITRNLAELDQWTRTEFGGMDLVLYNELLQLMDENDSSIVIDFIDREGALEVLYKAQYILHTMANKAAGDRIELVAHEVWVQEYEWTMENEKKLGFESPWPREIDGKLVNEYSEPVAVAV